MRRLKSQCPLLLVILDGWGVRAPDAHNAISQAHTPHWDQWWSEQPHTTLACGGPAVGLPAGQMGNSEVGHMHLGAGRVVAQDFTRINQAIETGSFALNPILSQALQSGKPVHFIGLLSPGGVHSHVNHLHALLDLAEQYQVSQVQVHAILDGRDTPPKSAESDLLAISQRATIATVMGRYWAMDRDNRQDRTNSALAAMTQQSGYQADSAHASLTAAYARDETDEFVTPTVINHTQLIKSDDIVICFNFRADRMRQLCQLLPGELITLTHYGQMVDSKPIFPPQPLDNTLGEYLATHGYHQYRIAETEKYAHVTYFFNGGREKPFRHETRQLIPSPNVKTYDLQPSMSADNITQDLITQLNQDKYDIYIINYANADMVGHTGNMNATIKAIEILDQNLGQLAHAIEAKQGQMLITADHGNAEVMFDLKTHQAHTAHSTGPVPLVYLGPQPCKTLVSQGSLIDVAPTVLSLLGLPIPHEMSGQVIFAHD